MTALPPIVSAVKAQQQLLKKQREDEGRKMGTSGSGAGSSATSSPTAVSPSSGTATRRTSNSQGGGAVASSGKLEMNFVISMIKGRHTDEFIRWVRDTEDIAICDVSGNTPLHWAANKGQSDMAAVLLRRGADPNTTNANGATPLHCAAFSGDSYTIELLLKNGADPTIRNEQGKTYADVCRAKGHAHLEPLLKQVEENARQAAIAASLSVDEETGSTLGLLEGDEAIPPHNWLVPTPSKLSRADVLERLQQQQQQKADRSDNNSAPRNNRSTSSIASYTVDTSNVTQGGGSIGHSDVNRTQPVLRQLSPDIRLPSSHHMMNVSPQSASSMPATHRLLDQQILLKNQEIVADVARKQAASQPLLVSTSPSQSSSSVGMSGSGASSTAAKQQHHQQQQDEAEVVVTSPVGCCACEGEARNQAMWSCDDCKKVDPQFCSFCNGCWSAEHASRRNRGHHRSRIVVVPPVMESVISSDLRGIPLDLNQLSAEAKAFILLQQQMLTILNRNNPPAPPPVQTAASACQTSPPPVAVHQQVQTNEDPRSPFFSDALMELQDIREQLEAEVYHSQQVIDTVRLQMMEALELKHRAEVETLYWRKLVNFRRPPQVVVIYSNQPMPSHLQNIPRQFAYAAQPAAPVVPPVAVAAVEPSPAVPVRARRNATCNQGIQCVILPIVVEEQTQTETIAKTPPKRQDGSAVPRYAHDAVELVYGEKHLPDQPQMLLVRWQTGAESWVPAYEVSHCEAVVAYLSRYDRSVVEASPLAGDRVGSPLDDEERNEVMRQLAMLQRIGTANGSRDSHSAGLANAAFAASKLLQYGVLPPAFQPAAVVPVVDDEALPLPPVALAGNDDDDESPIAETRQQQQQPRPSSDEALLRQYEEKLRMFEERHNALRKSREDATERMKKLSEKQELLDKNKRARVNVDYESQAPVLAAMQPDLPHPLYSTNDRHAALVLQKLQEEVKKVESQHEIAAQYRNTAAPKKQPAPSAPREEGTGARSGTGAAATAAAAIPLPPTGAVSTNVRSTTPPETTVTQPPRQAGETAESKAPTVALSDQEQQQQKTNRVLYEQYFYKKAGGESPSRQQEPQGDAETDKVSGNRSKPPLAPYVVPRGGAAGVRGIANATGQPRPASLN